MEGNGKSGGSESFLSCSHAGLILGLLTRSRLSLQRLRMSLLGFEAQLRVHMERSQVDSFLDGYGTDEGDVARSLWYPVPPPKAGMRGKNRGTRGQSNPPEPILSDVDAETSDSKEATSQHSESSESGDDDTGSGSESGGNDVEMGSGAESGDDVGSGSGSETDSDSGADRDSALESSPPRKRTKRTKRASRA
ncbi:hypothetical protein CsSME_00052403 [Camellia sinensis var. sinensis]